MKQVAQELLNVLVCPACRSALRRQGADRLECVNRGCGLRYPVRDGIPVMLIEEAEPPQPTTV